MTPGNLYIADAAGIADTAAGAARIAAFVDSRCVQPDGQGLILLTE
jgi:hypothetical protein